MAEVKWIKIVTGIFDDEKIRLIEDMPESDTVLVIWFKLLCLAGKTNSSGIVMLSDKIPYTEEMLSTIFRRPLNTVRLALTVFERYGMIEIVDGTITITNWEKHQNETKLESIREYNRLAKQEERQRKKQLLLSQGHVIDCQYTDIDIEVDKDIDKDNNDKHNDNDDTPTNRGTYRNGELFEKFWNAYPRKVGKGAAEKAFIKYKPDDSLFDRMLSALSAQKRSEQWHKDGGKFIPYPATWLNQRRWEDAPKEKESGWKTL